MECKKRSDQGEQHGERCDKHKALGQHQAIPFPRDREQGRLRRRLCPQKQQVILRESDDQTQQGEENSHQGRQKRQEVKNRRGRGIQKMISSVMLLEYRFQAGDKFRQSLYLLWCSSEHLSLSEYTTQSAVYGLLPSLEFCLHEDRGFLSCSLAPSTCNRFAHSGTQTLMENDYKD